MVLVLSRSVSNNECLSLALFTRLTSNNRAPFEEEKRKGTFFGSISFHELYERSDWLGASTIY